MRLSILISLLLLFASPYSSAVEMNAGWSILSAGTYHAGEAPRQPGGGWFGLVKKGESWSLLPTRIFSKRVRDDIVDADGQATGVEITADNPDAIAFFRHASLKRGPVETILSPPQVGYDGPRLVIDGPPLKLSYKNNKYRVVAVTREAPSPISSGSYILTISVNDGKELVMGTGTITDDLRIGILWSGDLNHDGFPDFLIRHDWYNGGGLCWHLSNSAGAGYQQIACQFGVGC